MHPEVPLQGVLEKVSAFTAEHDVEVRLTCAITARQRARCRDRPDECSYTILYAWRSANHSA